MFNRLESNLAQVRGALAAACRRAGRAPDEFTLIAVTKYVSTDIIRTLVELGVRDLGENRPQQLAARAMELADLPPGVRWHLIGHLQRNKVRTTLPHCRTIHSLDSARLAEELERQAALLDVPVDVFVEVNVSGETVKGGVRPDEADALVRLLEQQPHLRPVGLMTMAPLNPDPAAARPHFAALRELRDHLQRSGAAGPQFRGLSMGMTQDYVIAAEEGATHVRIGSALFEGLPQA